MGVPAFYRWLSEKYPKIVTNVLEQRNKVIDNIQIPVNLDEPNPNGLEYDNLYIDMNGLIHPCSHPEDRESPATEEEMYANITKYVDRLFAAVRPRRLLYLAIDGVAPRAKMNQQRSRRFRAAQEVKERNKLLEEVVLEMAALGLKAPPKAEEWDSNVITPGTEFMHRLSEYLWFYILERMNSHPSWKKIKVILSDSSEPGEGEHKIMNFIRVQRTQPDYDPNQRHILHGLDADLIMLALATHEAHFSILREEIVFGRKDKGPPSINYGQQLLDEQTGSSAAAASSVNPGDEWVFNKPLQVLNVSVLREYLMNEFHSLRFNKLPFDFDFERIVDDFVFMCFFVGNDFLPHLPSLDIRDGALDFLMECYKTILPSMGDYLTSPGGNVNLTQVDIILARVSEVEGEVFVRRQRSEEQQASRNRRSNFTQESAMRISAAPSYAASQAVTVKEETSVIAATAGVDTDRRNAEAASDLRKSLIGRKRKIEDVVPAEEQGEVKVDIDASMEASDDADIGEPGAQVDEESTELVVDEELEEELAVVPFRLPSEEESAGAEVEIQRRIKEKQSHMIDMNKKGVKDEIKYHESGYKDRYYSDNFKRNDVEVGGGLSRMCEAYVQGLCWVLKYYYEGCPSWQWYYPFHYAPFASDLVNIDSYQISFELSQPFNPVQQLLAVLPSDSVRALPEAVQWLMIDKESPIIDLYNDDVPLDPNGKHLPWLWVLLLPFVDDTRIVRAYEMCESNMSPIDLARNIFGSSLIFVHKNHPLSGCLLEHIPYDCKENKPDAVSHTFPAKDGQGISGVLSLPRSRWYVPLGHEVKSPYNEFSWSSDIQNNNVLCYEHKLPPAGKHESKVLEGTDIPPATLRIEDVGISKFPRLNKGRFNIADMVMKKVNENNVLNRGYNQQQHQQQQQFNRSYQSSGYADASRQYRAGGPPPQQQPYMPAAAVATGYGMQGREAATALYRGPPAYAYQAPPSYAGRQAGAGYGQQPPGPAPGMFAGPGHGSYQYPPPIANYQQQQQQQQLYYQPPPAQYRAPPPLQQTFQQPMVRPPPQQQQQRAPQGYSFASQMGSMQLNNRPPQAAVSIEEMRAQLLQTMSQSSAPSQAQQRGLNPQAAPFYGSQQASRQQPAPTRDPRRR